MGVLGDFWRFLNTPRWVEHEGPTYRCAHCGGEHALTGLEPSYGMPDAVFALPVEEREERATSTGSLCWLLGDDDSPTRYFVRSLVPFQVEGRARPCSWGIWTEVKEAAFREINELWDDPAQLQRGPWGATLANDAATYPATIGLRGFIEFVDVDAIPRFTPDSQQQHPFVREWMLGVSEQRALEWHGAFAH